MPPYGVGVVNHLTSWFGAEVDLDGYFLDPANLVADLEAAGLTVQANLGRGYTPGAEYPSRRY